MVIRPNRREVLRTIAGGTVAVSLLGPSVTASETDGGEKIWSYDTENSVYPSPTIIDGTVYVGGYQLFALDAESGDEEWTANPSSTILTSVTVVEGTLFGGGAADHQGNGTAFALGADAGETVWEREIDSWVQGSPAVAGGIAYFGTRGGTVYALDAESGDEVWTFEAGEVEYGSKGIEAPLTIYDETLYVGSRNGILYALEAGTGEELWHYETDEEEQTEIEGGVTIADGIVYFAGEEYIDNRRHSHLYALDAETGEEEWIIETNITMSVTPTVADGTIFYGSRPYIRAADAESGELLWEYDTGGSIRGSPTVVGETVFVGADESVWALDVESGDLHWEFEMNDFINSSPTVVDGTVYFGSGGVNSHDTNVYAVDAGVEGSSEGSRARLATEGHHEEWEYADHTLAGDPEEDDDDGIPAPGVAGTAAAIGGASYLLYRSRTGGQSGPD